MSDVELSRAALSYRIEALRQRRIGGATEIGVGMNWLLEMAELQIDIATYMDRVMRRASNA